jgi:virulence-associated protein VapD
MYAIAFDLVVADTLTHHPRGVAKPMRIFRLCWKRMAFDVCRGRSM